MDPYEELGLARAATADQVRAAHRRAAKRHHPDQGGDGARFDRVQRAFAILRDPEKRRLFDETGRIDEQPASGFDQRALAAARAALMSVVLGPQDLTGIDVIAGALNAVRLQVGVLESRRHEIERNIGRLDVARSRLRNLSEEPDLLGHLLDAQAAEMRAALPRVEEEVRVQRAAEAILKRYSYTFEMDGRPVSISREGTTLNVTMG